MSRRSLVLLTALSCLLVAGCSSMNVTSDFDDAYDFASATTFAFPPGLGKGTAGAGEVSPLVAKRVMSAIRTRLEAKGMLSGFKLALGPELWWGANPALLMKYQRNLAGVTTTAVFQEDFQRANTLNSSFAVPLPASFPLILMGLAMIGGAAVRRNRAAS